MISIFVAPARAALICTKIVGKAGYFRAYSPTRGTRENCIKAKVAGTAHKRYMSSHDQGGHMLETCRAVVGEREGGAVPGSERSSTSANRIGTAPLTSLPAPASPTSSPASSSPRPYFSNSLRAATDMHNVICWLHIFFISRPLFHA